MECVSQLVGLRNEFRGLLDIIFLILCNVVNDLKASQGTGV